MKSRQLLKFSKSVISFLKDFKINLSMCGGV